MYKPTLKTFFLLLAGILLFNSCGKRPAQETEPATSFRAPAYPLVTIDPYTSAWSESDQLFDSPVRHWTGKTHSLIGAARVDGVVYRFLGKEDLPLIPLLPMAKDEKWSGRYSLKAPAKGWESPGFDDKGWQKGEAAFGTPGMENIGTEWLSSEMWTRRTFTLAALPEGAAVYLVFSHDDDFELYLNGTQVVNTGRRARSQVMQEIDPALLNADGNNVIATHCLDRGGLAYTDYGIYVENREKTLFPLTAEQKSVALSATRTLYTFACGPVDLKLEFASPLLPDDLLLLSRPVSYLNYELVSNDGTAHEVQLYFETTPEWAVNDLSQEISVSSGKSGDVSYLKAGTTAQPVLERKGDNVRIDWGYFYMAAAQDESSSLGFGDYFGSKTAFIEKGLPLRDTGTLVTVMTRMLPAMSYVKDLGRVSAKPEKGFLMLAYDDVESIQYFGNNLKAYWREDGAVDIAGALDMALVGHDEIMKRSRAFDRHMREEAEEAGGPRYADLCALAYRQSVAAHKLVKDTEGNLLFLSKENFSNGSIGTVDVTYPSAPLYLKYNPELLKGMLIPIFYYSESGKWTKPFAAHDVGTYPKANGQTYGGDMPVEECGNMLILTAAIAGAEGNAAFAEAHWEVLTTWANYLLENGLDPENQLCTDDFAGHFAHNTNLSVKAIMGIAAYGRLASMLGKEDVAEVYLEKARTMAGLWMEMADDGDHYRLTFDQPGTWSQKYNLVWDKLLEFNLFPEEVARREVTYYLGKQNRYGLPLDNRRTYTKGDWIVWTATLAEDRETFMRFIDPLWLFVTETPDRVPMSDWYETPDARQVGFQARSVVGGYFIKMLE